MASLTQWTWIWVNSVSWWWTGRPGVLRFMGSQRVRHNWATELNWRVCVCVCVCVYNFTPFHQKLFQAWNALEISQRVCVTINRLCGPLSLSELNTNRSLVPEIHMAPCIKAIPKSGVYSQGFHSLYEVKHKTPHHYCTNSYWWKLKVQTMTF